MGTKARARLRPLLAAVFPWSVAVLVCAGVLLTRGGGGGGALLPGSTGASNLGKGRFSSLIRPPPSLENGNDGGEGTWVRDPLV